MGSARTRMILTPQLCAKVHVPSLAQAEQVPVSVCAPLAALCVRVKASVPSSGLKRVSLSCLGSFLTE